jgi:type VI secretion system secreted protein Hcp
MAMMVYMRITGKKQGDIEGDCLQPDREKTIMCYSMDHLLDVPADRQPGRIVHSPFRVSTHMGKHTHKIIQACRDAEPLDVEIDIYRVTMSGLEEKAFMLKLKNAIVVSTRQWFPNMLVDANKPFKHMQDIALAYESISWTFVPEEAEVTDSWRSSPAGGAPASA